MELLGGLVRDEGRNFVGVVWTEEEVGIRSFHLRDHEVEEDAEDETCGEVAEEEFAFGGGVGESAGGAEGDGRDVYFCVVAYDGGDGGTGDGVDAVAPAYSFVLAWPL